MSKYISTIKIAFLLTLANGILFTFLYLAINNLSSTPQYIVSIALFLVVLYLINNYLLKAFIGKNIDNIYEKINTKSELERSKKRKKTISEVEIEIGKWVKEKHLEINHLKDMDIYRKEFLGNITHELKTPIFIAQSYIETLLDGSIDDKKVNKKHLKKSLKSILRLSTIVQELEMISKLERNTMILTKDTFNINILIHDVIDSLEIRIKDEGVNVAFDSKNTENCNVLANREKVEQVIFNLLVNALKYRQKNNGWIKINCSIKDNKCLIEIQDNGIGIKKEDISRIFERFYRVDKDRSRKKGGTGLGLAIVKHILEAHNQTIKVISEYGKGTTFKFTLDLK